MAIKNLRLKTYINANATATIRGRAADCPVVTMEISTEDQNNIIATVRGSSGIPYQVTFTGLVFGAINSTCTCPFDHGKVCKHQVSLAIEAEAYFSNKDQETVELKEVEKAVKPVKYSTKDAYSFKLQEGVYLDDLIRLNTTKTTYKELFYDSDTVHVESIDSNYISLRVNNNYWSDEFLRVQIQKKEDELILLCNCRAYNKNLCKHQAKALNYLERTPNIIFFKTDKEIEEGKEKTLNEYGFTLKNEVYKDYFSFELEGGAYNLIPKKEGLLSAYEFRDLQEFNRSFLDNENVIIDQLPIFEKKTKTKKEKGVALGIELYNTGETDVVELLPLQGNINVEKTDLVSKIQRITAEEFLFEKENYTIEQQALIEKILAINILNETTSSFDFQKEKLAFKNLRELLALCYDNLLTYQVFLEDYSDKITRKNLEPISFKTEAPRLFFKVKEEAHFFVLKAYVEVEGSKKKIIKNKYVNNLYFLTLNKEYFLYRSFFDAKAFVYFNDTPEIRIPKTDFEKNYNSFIKPLSERFEVVIPHKKQTTKKVLVEDFKKQLYLSEIEDIIILKPVIEYNNKHIELLSPQVIEETETGKIIKRDTKMEQQFVSVLQNLHPHFENQNQSFFYIDKEDFITDLWFIDAFDILKENQIEVFGYDKLTKMKYNSNKPNIAVNVNSGIDWFDVNMEISFGDQQVSLKDVRKSIINKSNYVELKDGTLGILPQKWIEKYEHAFRSGEVKKDSIQVSKYQLSVIDSLYDTLDANSDIALKHAAIKKRLQSFKEIANISTPKGLKANLRDYQKEGLNWLNFLDEYNFGGCLADDMGLGKTLQIITFLQHLKNTKNPKKATLIILPTSLIFNWQEEIKKFCPTLNFHVHTGGDRLKTTENFDNFDIVFTTYGLIMRDVSFLKEYKFNYIILDESQAIKNPNSQRFKSTRLLQANNKLVLTGTPIENNTFDLFAQMTFANPGLLGSMANFKKEFATPIDKNKDAQIANELRQLINPFMLRRTKEQVATELPQKTEQILYCTMEPEQQKLYDAYKNKYRNYLLNKIDEDGIGKSKMYVLEGLTKLRQICDSPLLLNDDENYTSESIKIKELVAHVTEKTGNHKILIFSQFVKMLNQIKIALDAENIIYEYLDGRTKDRQSKVDNFQNNNDVRVFLISLKAGGTGLNLTAAEYVYLVDPWWNPAVEAQAIDRCYRIGQTKKVMAYKMICKGTVEEKIINYQIGKKQLSNDIIQTDENFVKALSKESITELFS